MRYAAPRRGLGRPGDPGLPTPLALVLKRLGTAAVPGKLLRQRASIIGIERPLSVPEVAAALQASDAYVRRLLIRRRLFGIKVGPVWAVYPEDLEAFKRLRRPPGRPRKDAQPRTEESVRRLQIETERAAAGTESDLRRGRSHRKDRSKTRARDSDVTGSAEDPGSRYSESGSPNQ